MSKVQNESSCVITASVLKLQSIYTLSITTINPCHHNPPHLYHNYTITPEQQVIKGIMPPRPFPLPYNIGVDIAQSTRFQKYINHCSSQKNVTKTRPIYRLLEKLMTPPEQRDFWMKYRSLSWIKHHKRKMACTAHIAGRCVYYFLLFSLHYGGVIL